VGRELRGSQFFFPLRLLPPPSVSYPLLSNLEPVLVVWVLNTFVSLSIVRRSFSKARPPPPPLLFILLYEGLDFRLGMRFLPPPFLRPLILYTTQMTRASFPFPSGRSLLSWTAHRLEEPAQRLICSFPRLSPGLILSYSSIRVPLVGLRAASFLLLFFGTIILSPSLVNLFSLYLG